jgi:hypothetical protein
MALRLSRNVVSNLLAARAREESSSEMPPRRCWEGVTVTSSPTAKDVGSRERARAQQASGPVGLWSRAPKVIR